MVPHLDCASSITLAVFGAVYPALEIDLRTIKNCVECTVFVFVFQFPVFGLCGEQADVGNWEGEEGKKGFDREI